MIDFKKMTEREVKLGETTFIIGKLNAMEGFKLLESIREQLGLTLSELNTAKMQEQNFLGEILKSVVRLPQQYVQKELIPILFNNIQFSKSNQVGGLRLHGAEEMAFIDPLHVYEVLLRALCVNFYSSFAGKLSALKVKD